MSSEEAAVTPPSVGYDSSMRDVHGFPGKYTIVKDILPGTPSSDPRDVRTTVPFPGTCPV